MQGVSNKVSKVANTKPPAMALDNCVHHWVEGAPSPKFKPIKSTFTPNTMGIKPSTVVMAVNKTGRRRKQPVSSAASFASMPSLRN